jgi:tRNA(Arg) A34 adenosine deaminase TadA
MCYGAAMWSGIQRLVVAGEGPELEQLTGFDEGPMREDWTEQFEQRGIHVVSDVLRDEAVAVFRAYGERTDAVVYNARGAVTVTS